MALSIFTDDEHITVTDAELEVADPRFVGDPTTVYTLRPLTSDDYKRIRKQVNKPAFNKYTHRLEENVDDTEYTHELLDYALLAWTGVVNKGEAIPCTREWKFRLDGQRKIALLNRAGGNQIERGDPFRSTASAV